MIALARGSDQIAYALLQKGAPDVDAFDKNYVSVLKYAFVSPPKLNSTR